MAAVNRYRVETRRVGTIALPVCPLPVHITVELEEKRVMDSSGLGADFPDIGNRAEHAAISADKTVCTVMVGAGFDHRSNSRIVTLSVECRIR